jgi:hypothetical protein
MKEMNTDTRKSILIVLNLSAALLLLAVYVASSVPVAGTGAGRAPEAVSAEIEYAALTGLAEIGWDTTGFDAKLVKVEGNFARVAITSSEPPGGFSAVLSYESGLWGVVAHGSAFNPADLEELGVPLSILTD